MTDYRRQRRTCGPTPLDVAAPSVSFIDKTGRLVKRLGECQADACIINELILGRESPSPTRSTSEFYIFATVAQGVQEVSQGIQPSFSRRCNCPAQEKKRPCLVKVEPYFAGVEVAGAKITCHHIELEDSTVDC